VELFDEEVLDKETRAILQSRIAKSTRKNYIDTLFRSIRFIFDNIAGFEGIVNPLLLQRMTEAHALDQARINTNGSPCKRRDHLKRAVAGFIAAIVGGRAETHPLVLRRLTFNVFAKWMKTFKKSVKRHRTQAPADEDWEGEDLVVVEDVVTVGLTSLLTWAWVPSIWYPFHPQRCRDSCCLWNHLVSADAFVLTGRCLG
jgi:hypothetical protein